MKNHCQLRKPQCPRQSQANMGCSRYLILIQLECAVLVCLASIVPQSSPSLSCQSCQDYDQVKYPGPHINSNQRPAPPRDIDNTGQATLLSCCWLLPSGYRSHTGQNNTVATPLLHDRDPCNGTVWDTCIYTTNILQAVLMMNVPMYFCCLGTKK